MTAREELFSVACDDMPVSGTEVNEAIDAYKRELLGVDPACSAEYLRKRFSERIWEQVGPLAEFLLTLSECAADEVVTNLVEGLLIEAGVE